MTYTFDEALGKIRSGEIVTLADFELLVRDTSAAARNAIVNPTYLLYAGDLPGALPEKGEAWRAAQAFRDASIDDVSGLRRAVVLGSDTAVGELLQEPEFKTR